MRPSKHAHRLVIETAEAIGHELYDHMMHDNSWYEIWKAQNPDLTPKALEELFVQNNISRLLPQARATLTQMMTTTPDQDLKETIYQALVLDNQLIRGRLH